MRKLSPLVLLVGLASCRTIAGRDFDLVAASRFQAGQAKRAEVEQVLGKAEQETRAPDGGKVLVWHVVHDDPMGKGGEKRARLKFGADGVLAEAPVLWAAGIDEPLLNELGAGAVVEKPRVGRIAGLSPWLLAPAQEQRLGCFAAAFQQPASEPAVGESIVLFRVGAGGSAEPAGFTDVQPPPATAEAIVMAVRTCAWKPRPQGEPRSMDPLFLRVPLTSGPAGGAEVRDLRAVRAPVEVHPGCIARSFPTEHQPGWIVTGTVLVRFLVNERGHTEQFQIFPDAVSAAHRNAIVDELSRCTWEPARDKAGRPLPFWAQQLYIVRM